MEVFYKLLSTAITIINYEYNPNLYKHNNFIHKLPSSLFWSLVSDVSAGLLLLLILSVNDTPKSFGSEFLFSSFIWSLLLSTNRGN